MQILLVATSRKEWEFLVKLGLVYIFFVIYRSILYHFTSLYLIKAYRNKMKQFLKVRKQNKFEKYRASIALELRIRKHIGIYLNTYV